MKCNCANCKDLGCDCTTPGGKDCSCGDGECDGTCPKCGETCMNTDGSCCCGKKALGVK